MKRISAMFFSLFALLVPAAAFGQQAATYGAGDGGMLKSVLAISAAVTIGLAAIGGTLAQSRVASVTLEGIARNPEAAGKTMTPMIIALALIESLVIYALVIAFLLQGKI